MWSVGCILAQIFKRKSILRGSTTKNQIGLIFELIGTPTPNEIANISNPKSRKFVEKFKKCEKKDFKEFFPETKLEGLDLLENLLKFDPKKRLTVEQAINHPYLIALHNLKDEPKCNKLNSLEFEFENHMLIAVTELRTKDEIDTFVKKAGEINGK